jgi:hypothetical protein
MDDARTKIITLGRHYSKYRNKTIMGSKGMTSISAQRHIPHWVWILTDPMRSIHQTGYPMKSAYSVLLTGGGAAGVI